MLDKEMREPLFDFLDEYYGKIRTIEEKIIARSRADVLGIIDDAIIGFEIKSDSDTYKRLKTQVRDYEKFCDYCFAVVGKSHEKHVEEHIPDDWGIIVVSPEEVVMVKEPKLSPKVKVEFQLAILWRREIADILYKEGLPKYDSYARAKIYERMIAKIEPEQLKKDISEQLFERDYTIFDPELMVDDEKARKALTKNGRLKSSSDALRKKKKVRSMKSRARKALHVSHVVSGKRKKRRKSE